MQVILRPAKEDVYSKHVAQVDQKYYIYAVLTIIKVLSKQLVSPTLIIKLKAYFINFLPLANSISGSY